MTLTTITIGWTKHDTQRDQLDYIPFLDVWTPEQPQHTETIQVELPDHVYGQQVAELVFTATNVPEEQPKGTLAGRILAAIQTTGYRGEGAHWSLSVGDTVTVDGTTWKVARYGWELHRPTVAEEAEALARATGSSSATVQVERRHADGSLETVSSGTSSRTNHATDEFNMVWQNDQDVYREVLAMARELLRRVPGMTDQTLGRNVKDRVFSWAFGGGWGYSTGWGGSVSSLRDCDRFPDWSEGAPPRGYRTTPFSYFLDRDQYGQVSEEAVAEDVREALGLEGYNPETGNVQ